MSGLPPRLQQSDALLTGCGRYRYTLWRVWNRRAPLCLFVGIAPGPADQTRNDPMVEACMRHAYRWGCGGICVVNLFAMRTLNLRILQHHPESVGPRNDHWIQRAAGLARLTVVAWGAYGDLHGRDQQVLRYLKRPCCLGTTPEGQPLLPMRADAEATPRTYVPRARTAAVTRSAPSEPELQLI